ncbi:MAG: mechanosensitive ion channel [Acidimicrobiales bacterium]|nr:mechanosensitive ion channel [Acidimicrobiales bacterium]RZV43223.1 MAG: mechanosensitive ion channel [Acidimicrobiales bacterium]
MDGLQDWLTTNGPTYLVRLAGALVVFWIGRKVVNWLAGLAEKGMERGGLEGTLRGFLVSILRAILLVLVIIAALGTLGIETTSFAAILAAAGLAVGLALQGTLANFASGVMLLLFKPYKAGDLVEIGGVLGVVDEIQIFNTLLTTPDNKLVIMPNAQVTSGPITNLSGKGSLRVDLVAGIGYDDDLKQAKSILQDILDSHPKVLAEPAPAVTVMELGDNSVNFAVRPYATVADYWDVYFDVTESIKLRLDEAGISIPYPQRDIHIIGPEDAAGAL